MYVTLLLQEVASALRQIVSQRFQTHPRTSFAVASAAGFVALWVAWSVVVAFFWSPQRNVYGSVSGTVTSVTGGRVTNVVVSFVNETAGVGASSPTDSGGHFWTHGILPGRYAVAIQPAAEGATYSLTKEDVVAARSRLDAEVPSRFQDAATSGLSVELKRGRNRYDVDLREKH